MNAPLRSLFTELEIAQAVFEQARRDFLAVLDTYQQRGASLEGRLKNDLTRTYLDPAHDRAQIVRQAAEAIIRSTRTFTSSRSTITGGISTLCMGLNTVGSALQVAALRAIVEAVSSLAPSRAPDLTRRTVEDIRALLQSLDDAQASHLIQIAQGVAALKAATQAIRLATASLTLRLGMMEDFLGEAQTARTGAVIGAIGDVLVPEAREVVFEQVLEAAAILAKVTAESLFPVVRLATVAYDLRKALLKLNEGCKRAPVDDMLDFALRLTESDLAADKVGDHIHGVTDAIIKPWHPAASQDTTPQS